MIKHRQNLKSSSSRFDEVLGYCDLYKFYRLIDKEMLAGAMHIDEEDRLNILARNYDEIRKKYNLDPSISSFKIASDEPKAAWFYKTSEDKLIIPKDIYKMTIRSGDIGFQRLDPGVDRYIKFENSEMDVLQNNIETFFASEDLYKENETRHKGATLIYGPPGSGKSSALLNIVKNCDVYTIYIPKYIDLSNLDTFKEYFKGQKVIIIMEELTERLRGGTEDLLNFMDGYTSWDNCYVLATTNHPEELPENIVDRPGRFNNIIELKVPPNDIKEKYLRLKGVEEALIPEILLRTKDCSFDYISQIVIQSKVRKINIIDYLEEIKLVKKKVKNAFSNKSQVGM